MYKVYWELDLGDPKLLFYNFKLYPEEQYDNAIHLMSDLNSAVALLGIKDRFKLGMHFEADD